MSISSPQIVHPEANVTPKIEESTIRITVIDRMGNRHELEAPTDLGLNLMEFLKACEFPVQATCGGMAICSTCHVFVESEQHLKQRSEAEELALEQSFLMDECKSRLSCQLPLSPQLDGLVVRIAPEE
ncbi:MAG: 2Fe-2S iron-sulfur cluster-binding protein [Bacteroidota bacterium]